MKHPALKGAAIAAIVLLSAILVAVFIFNKQGANDSFVVHNPELDTPTAQPLTIVASLTAEHDAVWQRRPGLDLYAGQRLTLIQGFAEITTTQGAVAVIQGPTSLELIYDKNALYLHTGKLVGICETESSKGFVVRTPHMDITDLGTRFGVAIDEAGATLAEVFEGSIRVDAQRPSRAGFESIQMQYGNAVALDQHGSMAKRDQFDPVAFVNLVEYVDEAYSTDRVRILGDLALVDHNFVFSANNGALPRLDKAWIYEELVDFVVPEDMPVSLGRGHRSSPISQQKYETIAKGTRISSYIIGFNPSSANGNGIDQTQPAIGQVTFDRQVLGIISVKEHWDQFDQVANQALSGTFLQTDPGMMLETEPIDGKIRDRFMLQPFRRILDIQLDAASGPDLMRVIVLESPFAVKP